MSLNLNSKNTFFVFDDFGMLTVKSDALSWRDSIGMTVCAWIAYDKPWQLSVALHKCTMPGKKLILWRHPSHTEHSSRDHWSYMIIHWKLKFMVDDYLKHYIAKVPFMRGLYLWMHSLTGNRLAEWIYYTLYIPGAVLGNVWLKFCRWTGRIRPERSNEWWVDKEVLYAEGLFLALDEANGWKLQNNRIKWQKLWAWIIFQTIPAYPLHNKGWQLYVMPESKRKERLKKILLKRVGKSNILLRLLFEPKVIYNADYLKSSYKLVTQEEVDTYPNMTGFRPGVYLDETCRRTIRELTAEEAEFNCYEKDLIIWLYGVK